LTSPAMNIHMTSEARQPCTVVALRNRDISYLFSNFVRLDTVAIRWKLS
jgi:hypothetical protein